MDLGQRRIEFLIPTIRDDVHLLTFMANSGRVKVVKATELPVILEKYTYVIVNFFTSWLAASYEVAPIIEKLAHKYPKIKFVTVDVSKNQDLLRAYNCPGLPDKSRHVSLMMGLSWNPKRQANKAPVPEIVPPSSRLLSGTRHFAPIGSIMCNRTDIVKDETSLPPENQSGQWSWRFTRKGWPSEKLLPFCLGKLCWRRRNYKVDPFQDCRTIFF
ncbi:hypothetical protein SprV_0200526000 [Sparganum proliferum]